MLSFSGSGFLCMSKEKGNIRVYKHFKKKITNQKHMKNRLFR